MEFTDDDIKEFRKIWKAEFREDLSDADARIAAQNLMEFFMTLIAKENPPKPDDAAG